MTGSSSSADGDGRQSTRFAAILLAGGAATRLGGVDKPATVVRGATMLQTVLDAVVDARPRVVVGPGRSALPADVVVAREHPPGGGPLAATAAGVRAVLAAPDPPPKVVLLASDLPWLDTSAVLALVRTLADPAVDGVVYVDDDGRRQWLCGAWRTSVLADRLDAFGVLAGVSMRHALGGLTVAGIHAPQGSPPPWFDCDTDEDLKTAEEWWP